MRKDREYQVEAIITLLSDASPEHKEQIMTVADQLRQQGMIQGVEKGIATVARNLLNEGTEISFVAKTTGLTEAQLLVIKAKGMLH